MVLFSFHRNHQSLVQNHIQKNLVYYPKSIQLTEALNAFLTALFTKL